METENNEPKEGTGVMMAGEAIAAMHEAYLKEVSVPAGKMILSMQDALKRARALPGRPPTEFLLKQMMLNHGLTRAQAKTKLKLLDRLTAGKLQVMEQGDVAVNNVSTLSMAVAGTVRGR